MDFGFDEEQELIHKTAREFFNGECSKFLVREMIEDEKGYSPDLWCKMADLGWMGLILPVEYGGAGSNFLNLVVLLEEMGRACLPGPFLSTVILGGLTVLEAGNESQRNDILPKIANGELITSLALCEVSVEWTAGSIEVRAVADAGDYVINGRKLFVSDAHIADHIIAVVRTKDSTAQNAGISLFLTDARMPGLNITLLPTISGYKQCEVNYESVKVSQESLLGDIHCGWSYMDEVLKKATIAKCAEMVGRMQQAMGMTIEYSKQRVQFEKPIGSFQAIQHHCTNMLIDVDTSKFLTYQAAWRLQKGLPCNQDVSMAKSFVSDASIRVMDLAHQVHGGVAYMKDHDLGLYTQRLMAEQPMFGDASFHREIVAQEAGF